MDAKPQDDTKNCLQCGAAILAEKPRSTCNRACSRLWYAGRFARWEANPGQVSLPEGLDFDTYLAQDELQCVVAGCDWRGQCLSSHTNRIHGISGAELKRLLGFNRKTGLAALPLIEKTATIHAARMAALDPAEIRRRLAAAWAVPRCRGVRAEARLHIVKAGSSAARSNSGLGMWKAAKEIQIWKICCWCGYPYRTFWAKRDISKYCAPKCAVKPANELLRQERLRKRMARRPQNVEQQPSTPHIQEVCTDGYF